MNDLGLLFKKYKCDKVKHGYHKIYEQYIEERRYDELNVLEIGTLFGNSIKSWLDYMPNSNIYTIDTFERINADQVEVLKNERVKWHKCNSTTTRLKDIWNIDFDIIIDDGFHSANAQRRTFHNSFENLKEGGFYFIEDVHMPNMITHKQLENLSDNMKNWFKQHCSLNEINSLLNAVGERANTLEVYNLNRTSLRKTCNSCLLVIGK